MKIYCIVFAESSARYYFIARTVHTATTKAGRWAKRNLTFGRQVESVSLVGEVAA